MGRVVVKPEWSILILSRYSQTGASSRLRTHQFISYLEAAGAQVTVSSFFDDTYLIKLYRSGERRVRDIACAYLRRTRICAKIRKYDVVWVEKEVFPFLPSAFESLLFRSGTPYVVDYDDAIFHTYDLHKSGLMRLLLRTKFDRLLQCAKVVTVGNAYLEKYVRIHGACNVARIPTVVDLSRYAVAREPISEEFRIGWIGTPATTKYLYLVREPLRQFAREQRMRLVTIGASLLLDFGVPLEQHPWSTETEVALLSNLHIGIMPLPNEPWERGKCGYKLIQYMACGRPVVASPVGVNVDIVTNDVGFLSRTPKHWIEAFKCLVADASLRARLGKEAREKVKMTFSLQAVAPRVVKVLTNAAGVQIEHP